MNKREKLNKDLKLVREKKSALAEKEKEILSQIEALDKAELNKIMKEKSLAIEDVIKLISEK